MDEVTADVIDAIDNDQPMLRHALRVAADLDGLSLESGDPVEIVCGEAIGDKVWLRIPVRRRSDKFAAILLTKLLSNVDWHVVGGYYLNKYREGVS